MFLSQRWRSRSIIQPHIAISCIKIAIFEILLKLLEGHVLEILNCIFKSVLVFWFLSWNLSNTAISYWFNWNGYLFLTTWLKFIQLLSQIIHLILTWFDMVLQLGFIHAFKFDTVAKQCVKRVLITMMPSPLLWKCSLSLVQIILCNVIKTNSFWSH